MLQANQRRQPVSKVSPQPEPLCALAAVAGAGFWMAFPSWGNEYVRSNECRRLLWIADLSGGQFSVLELPP